MIFEATSTIISEYIIKKKKVHIKKKKERPWTFAAEQMAKKSKKKNRTGFLAKKKGLFRNSRGK